MGSIKNPVDVIGDARHDRYRAALDAVTADEGVDQVLVIVTPQTMTDVTEIAEVIGETKEFCNKPMAACLMGLVDVSAGVELLQKQVRRADVRVSGKRHAGVGGEEPVWRVGPFEDPRLPAVRSGQGSRRRSCSTTSSQPGASKLIEVKALGGVAALRLPDRAVQSGADGRRSRRGRRGDGLSRS